MADVFLSYARTDRDRLREFVAYLEQRGLAVFWDHNVQAGSDWRKVLQAEIQNAGVVVVAWSKHSVDSSFVQDEAAIGHRNHCLVPVRIDAVDLPLGFGGVQTYDLTNLESGSAAEKFEPLVAVIRERLALSAKQKPAMAAPFASPRTQEGKRHLWLGGVVAAGVLLIGSLLGLKLAAHGGLEGATTGSQLTSKPSATGLQAANISTLLSSASASATAAELSLVAPIPAVTTEQRFASKAPATPVEPQTQPVPVTMPSAAPVAKAVARTAPPKSSASSPKASSGAAPGARPKIDLGL